MPDIRTLGDVMAVAVSPYMEAQNSVRSRTVAAPPASPPSGERYIVPADATGDWGGHEPAIAMYRDGAWTYLVPDEGVTCWVNDEDALVAFDGLVWGPIGGGGAGGTASGLGTTGDPVDVASAAPPVAGQVLTAVDPEHAEWRVPGLHYDPSIKFWTSTEGSATILPGSWGFIQQPPAATEPVVVHIVSSLEAPPVDSRFGLYVWREMTVPVTINVLGESQIQGLDGVLGTSALLLPGADYEWVFYHEDGAAIWGLVSDTAGVAKRLITNAGVVELGDSDPPNPGDVLTAVDAEHAVWLPPSGGGGGLVLGSGSSPGFGEWVSAASGTNSVLPAPDEPDRRVGIYVSRGTTGATVSCSADLMIDRNTVNAAPLRPGAWYEWVSRDFGEDIRWVPVGGSGTSARPPLEYPMQPYGALEPNQWILASDVSGVANMPQAPKHGDVFGLYTDEPCDVIPATGHSIESPDLEDIVTAPSSISLSDSTYYEWIFTEADSTWHPRQNMLALHPQAVLDAIFVASGSPDLDGKRIVNVGDPVDPQDAATKAYVDTATGGVAITAGAGLTLTAGTLAVGANADASIVVNADDIQVGVLATDAQHGTRGGDALHAVATTTTAGFQSAADKTKLSNLSQSYKTPVRVRGSNNITLSGLQTIDGVALANSDRVLLTGQSTPSQNGIWLASPSAWTRALDATANADVLTGMIVPVNEGSLTARTTWILTTLGPIIVGTTSLSFQFFGGAAGTSAPSSIVPVTGSSTGGVNRWAHEDHVHAFPAPQPALNNFRLSSSADVPGADVSAAGTVYLTPYTGNRIALWLGASWQIVAAPGNATLIFSGATAGTPLDIFAVYNGLTNNPTLESVSWTNSTTRATALGQQDGVTIKAGDPTRRYVGTILPDSATTYSHIRTASGATSPVCGIWNQDNRIRGSFAWTPTFDTWTILSANTWQQINAQASARVQYVQGRSIDVVVAEFVSGAASGGSIQSIGIGLDSTTAPSGFRGISGSNNVGLHASFNQLVAVGAHNLNALAIANNTSANFYGAHAPMQGGITAELWY